MREGVQEKCTKAIKRKVVTMDGIRHIAHTLYDIHSEYVREAYDEADPSQYRGAKINFELHTADDREYSTSQLDIFVTGGVLDTKVITAIVFTFTDYSHDVGASIHLAASQYRTDNIAVEGTTKTWVEGTFNRRLRSDDNSGHQTFHAASKPA